MALEVGTLQGGQIAALQDSKAGGIGDAFISRGLVHASESLAWYDSFVQVDKILMALSYYPRKRNRRLKDYKNHAASRTPQMGASAS